MNALTPFLYHDLAVSESIEEGELTLMFRFHWFDESDDATGGRWLWTCEAKLACATLEMAQGFMAVFDRDAAIEDFGLDRVTEWERNAADKAMEN
jgi:NADH:ubiquinone oxidoreductase subunit B-like Fe-S oxidoreductase